MSKEIWKDVPGYEGLYQVSNLGGVKSVDRTVPCRKYGTRNHKSRLLKQHPQNCGYLIVVLCKENKPSSNYVHRLVYKAFVENISGFNTTVDHINGCKIDNRIENLACMSRGDNARKYTESQPLKGGVWLDTQTKKWRGGVRSHRTKRFETKYQAEQAVQQLLKEISKCN